jgi:hypothetical protein
MKKYIITTIVLVFLLIAGSVYAASFNSGQVGGSAANGFVLQTNGNISTWVATSTLGLGGSGGGTVTSIATNNGLTGGTITTTGTLGLAAISANSVLGNISSSSAVPTALATSSLFQNASASLTGLLSSTDWSTFNNKQASGNYITALTGDVTASGPGSVAATLATVNGNVGSFTNANITVNAKGLITAVSNGSGGGSPYPFQVVGNATSTLTQFNGGLTAYASSTIGAGGQATGLTVSGGATTTGNIVVTPQSATNPDLTLGGASNVTTYAFTAAGGRAMFGYDLTRGTEVLNAGSSKGIDMYVNGTNGTFISGTNALAINTAGQVGISSTTPNHTLSIGNYISFDSTGAMNIGYTPITMYQDAYGSLVHLTGNPGYYFPRMLNVNYAPADNTAFDLGDQETGSSYELPVNGGCWNGSSYNCAQGIEIGSQRYTQVGTNYYSNVDYINSYKRTNGTTTPIAISFENKDNNSFETRYIADYIDPSGATAIGGYASTTSNSANRYDLTIPLQVSSSTASTIFAVDSTPRTHLFQVTSAGIASTTNLTISNVASCSGSNALTTNASGVVACGAISGGGGGSAYPFPLTGNGTSTPLMILASTTIGNGTLGLTNNGNATTTGTAYFAGKVGIGTTTPQDSLVVQGTSGQNTVVNLANPGTSNTAELRFTVNGVSGTGFTFKRYGSAIGSGLNNTGELWNFESTGNAGIRVGGSGGETARFDTINSRLGIGSTTPGTILSIGNTGANTINISNTATSTFGSGININSGCFAINGTCVGGSGGGGGSGTVNSGTTGQFPFYASSGTAVSATSTLFLNASGYLGVGTTTPSASLDVNGGIYSETQNPVVASTMTIDFCAANNSQSITVSSTAVAISFTNANKCVGKTEVVNVTAPASGTIGATTFAGGSNSGAVVWDGGFNPGNSAVYNSTDKFVFTSMATSTNFISADIAGTY